MSEPTAAEPQSSGEDSHASLMPDAPPSTDPAKKEASDDEQGEKPVREKLRNTSIDTLSQSRPSVVTESDPSETSQPLDSPTEAAGTSQGSRGRPVRKRSFDDLQEDVASATSDSPQKPRSHHKRMRSREVTNGEMVESHDADQPEMIAPQPISPSCPAAKADPILRPATPPPDSAANNDLTSSAMLSPQKKRNHDHLEYDAGEDGLSAEQSDGSYVHVSGDDTEEITQPTGQSGKGEPEKKRTRDASRESSKEVSASTVEKKGAGFGNPSSVSPFGAQPVESSRTSQNEPQTTSSSAFASSGLSVFARSESSPFGALSGTTSKPVGFGGGSTNGKSALGFGNTGASSPFASGGASGLSGLSASSSGFGGAKQVRGFGSASGFASASPLGGLSSFASPAGSSGIIGATSGPAKAFGAPENGEDEIDEEGSGDSGDEDPEAGGEEKAARDKRFIEQEMETGEESEATIFSCKAKLFNFDKEWKERGIGTFKLNVNEGLASEFGHGNGDISTGVDTEKKARFIMRTEGVHRVVLNTPVFKGMKVGTNEGKEPTGKMLNLSAVESGKFVPLLLKTGSLEMARDLYRKVTEVQDKL